LPAGRRLLVLELPKIPMPADAEDACAGTVCLPRSKRCRIPAKEKKREASIDLDAGPPVVRPLPPGVRRRPARRCRDSSHLRRFRLEPQPACRCPHRCECADRFPLRQARARRKPARFSPFTMAKNVQRLAAVRAGKRAHVFDHAENFTFTWRNISMALRTSASATVEGVVTRQRR